MPVEIRPFAAGDAEALWHLFYQTVHTVNRRDYAPEQLDVWAPHDADLAAWSALFDRRIVFVAEVQRQIAGFAEMEPAQDEGRVERFYVHRDHQREGIGARLYAALEAEARARSLKRLTVEASITARPFFERMGFGNTRPQQVERHGVELINYAMEKRLRRTAARNRRK